MHDGMQYDPIQGQGQSVDSRKFGHFQRLSPTPFIMGLANDHGFLNWSTIPKAYRGWIFVLVFVSRNFEVGSK